MNPLSQNPPPLPSFSLEKLNKKYFSRYLFEKISTSEQAERKLFQNENDSLWQRSLKCVLLNFQQFSNFKYYNNEGKDALEVMTKELHQQISLETQTRTDSTSCFNVTASCLLKPITTSCLETELEDQWMIDVDIHYNCHFEDYLEPNEEYPEGIIPHLVLAGRNIIVSTGTERSLFDLTLGDFEALVMRDINPRVKAYNDFNILLLRLSDNLKEYRELSAPLACDYNIPLMERAGAIVKSDAFRGRMAIISSKIEKSDLSPKAKEYYSKHLHSFASIYLSQQQKWRNNPRYSSCHYHENNSQFIKLQEYARAGRIISTLGSINDLAFLNKHNVSLIDTSNIWNYIPINIQGLSSSARIVTTEMNSPTEYYSCIHTPFSEDEKMEFDELFDLLASCYDNQRAASIVLTHAEKGHQSDPFNISDGRVFFHKVLPFLRDYVAQSIIALPGFAPVDMKGNIKKLNTYSSFQIQKICGNRRTKHFSDDLVNSWKVLLPATYIGFSKMEGWKEAFERNFFRQDSELVECLFKIQKAGLLAEFIENFGQDRMDALLAQCLRANPFLKEEWPFYFKGASLSDGIASIL